LGLDFPPFFFLNKIHFLNKILDMLPCGMYL